MQKKKSASSTVNTLITLTLMFGFGLLPPFGCITKVGMRVLGVFIGVIYGYSTCDIIWPSLFAVLAFGLSGYTTMGGAISSMIGNSTVFQSLACLITAGSLTYYGFGKWLIRKSLTITIFSGKPLLYTWAFMVLFGLLSIFISQIPLAILLYSIWQDIADNCGYPKNSSFRYVGMGGILLGTICGGGMIPYYSWQNGLTNAWAEAAGVPLNFGIMAAATVPATMLTVTLYVLITKPLFKVDYSIMKEFDVNKLGEESKHLRPRAKRILVLYFITVLTVILGNTLSGSFLDTFVNKTMTTAGMYCLCTAILMILPSGEGDRKSCIVFNEVKDTSISWPVLLMCAVTLPVASALTSDCTGIVESITAVIEPVLVGHDNGFLLLFTITVTLILVNIGSNMALGAALIPIIAPFAVSSGVNPSVIGGALIFIINIGIMLPGVSAPAAIFHSNEALPDSRMRFKVTTASLLCVTIVSNVVFGLASSLLT